MSIHLGSGSECQFKDGKLQPALCSIHFQDPLVLLGYSSQAEEEILESAPLSKQTHLADFPESSSSRELWNWPQIDSDYCGINVNQQGQAWKEESCEDGKHKVRPLWQQQVLPPTLPVQPSRQANKTIHYNMTDQNKCNLISEDQNLFPQNTSSIIYVLKGTYHYCQLPNAELEGTWKRVSPS